MNCNCVTGNFPDITKVTVEQMACWTVYSEALQRLKVLLFPHLRPFPFLPIFLSLPQLIKDLSDHLSPSYFFYYHPYCSSSLSMSSQWSGISVWFRVIIMVTPPTHTHTPFPLTSSLPVCSIFFFHSFFFFIPLWLSGRVPKVVHPLFYQKTGSLTSVNSIYSEVRLIGCLGKSDTKFIL